MQFPKGTRMIEACKEANAEVPHYCYHPKLSSPGNCRMCLVEMGMPPRLAPGQEAEKDEDGHTKISWMPRPAIACANTVANGMGIRTTGPLVEECRKGVMEFLLINHPLDSPICDQAGECRLQEFSVEHGQGESRFLETRSRSPRMSRLGRESDWTMSAVSCALVVSVSARKLPTMMCLASQIVEATRYSRRTLESSWRTIIA